MGTIFSAENIVAPSRPRPRSWPGNARRRGAARPRGAPSPRPSLPAPVGRSPRHRSTSGRPPARLATTGAPHAMASSAARPKDSVCDGRRKRSLLCSRVATESSRPRNRTSLLHAELARLVLRVDRSGPSPIMMSVARHGPADPGEDPHDVFHPLDLAEVRDVHDHACALPAPASRDTGLRRAGIPSGSRSSGSPRCRSSTQPKARYVSSRR